MHGHFSPCVAPCVRVLLARDLPALALYCTALVVVYNADVLDNWCFAPGGFGGGVPTPHNKHQFPQK